jgi:hypothetical protein
MFRSRYGALHKSPPFELQFDRNTACRLTGSPAANHSLDAPSTCPKASSSDLLGMRIIDCEKIYSPKHQLCLGAYYLESAYFL